MVHVIHDLLLAYVAGSSIKLSWHSRSGRLPINFPNEGLVNLLVKAN